MYENQRSGRRNRSQCEQYPVLRKKGFTFSGKKDEVVEECGREGCPTKVKDKDQELKVIISIFDNRKL